VAFSADYLRSIVAHRLSETDAFKQVADGSLWLHAHLSQEIETVLQRHQVRSGYAVLEGVTRPVWALPISELKLEKGKTLRPGAVGVARQI
jgi:hypothetical protein